MLDNINEKSQNPEKLIIEQNGCLYYTENGVPKHEGIFKLDGNVYYASKNGEIIRGRSYVVHSSMSHGIVKHGTYRFDENGVIDLESFRAPKARKKHRGHRKKKHFKTNLIAGLISLALIVSVIIVTNIYNSPGGSNEPYVSSEEEIISVQHFSEPVYLCSNEMAKYYKGNRTFKQVADKEIDQHYVPFKLSYLTNNEAKLIIEDNTYNLDPYKSSITIDNLKTGHHYDFKVIGKDTTVNGSFDTADSNRFIFMDGVHNTRDIGGYTAEKGKRIKQGMIIRGSEVDGLVEKDYKLKSTESINCLNFKYDMDLRDCAISSDKYYVSPLGKNVKHDFYNSPMYSAFFARHNRETVKRMFEALSDSSNYPMYLHCTYGADRTGTFVFLLQGLLGVSYNDMVFEYELTGLWLKDYATGENLNNTIDTISSFEGDTVQEKIKNFLVNDVGLSEETISSIKSLLLEDAGQ